MLNDESFSIDGVKVLPWGDTFYCWADDMGRDMLHNTPFEEGEQRYFLNTIKEGEVFYDVGAHHGLYTLLASYKVGSRGLVVSFEPSGTNLRVLHKHISLTGRSNVMVEPYAVSDYVGDGIFREGLGGTGLNYLARKGRNDGRAVNVTTLDAFVHAGWRPPNYIKMDIEGGEMFALKGAEATLKTYKPTLLVELHEQHALRSGYSANETRDYVSSLGYTWHQASPEGILGAPTWGRPLSHTLFALCIAT